MPVVKRGTRLRQDVETRYLDGSEEDVLVLLGEYRLADSVRLLNQLHDEVDQDFRMLDNPKYRTESRAKMCMLALALIGIVTKHLTRRVEMLTQPEVLNGPNRRFMR